MRNRDKAAIAVVTMIVIATGGAPYAQAPLVSEVADRPVTPLIDIPLARLLPSPDAATNRDIAAWVFTAAAATDWATTAHSLAYHHGHEGNPLINWAPTPAATIAVGEAVDVVGLALWQRLMRKHPRTAGAGLYVASALRLFVAGRNEYRIAHPGTCAAPPPCAINCIEAFARCR